MHGQRVADATGIPRLSAMAEAAISAVCTAPDEKPRAEAERAVQKDERVVAELSATVKQGEWAGAATAQREAEHER